MEHGTPVKDAFVVLNKYRVLVVPMVVSVVLSFVIAWVFLGATGLLALGQDFSNDVRSAQEQGVGDVPQHLVDAGYVDRFLSLFTIQNVYWFVGTVVVFLLQEFYFACMSFLMIRDVQAGRRVSWGSVLRGTHRYFLRFSAVRLLVMLAVFAPSFVILGVPFMFVTVAPPLVLAGLVLLCGALSILYMVYMTLRFMFSTPALFLEERRVFFAVQRTYRLTRIRFGHVIVIGLVLLGFMLLTNGAAEAPMRRAFLAVTFGQSLFLQGVYLLVFLVLSVVAGVLFTVQHIYLFNAFVAYKSSVKA